MNIHHTTTRDLIAELISRLEHSNAYEMNASGFDTLRRHITLEDETLRYKASVGGEPPKTALANDVGRVSTSKT